MSENVISMRHTFPSIAKKLEDLPAIIANKALVRALNASVAQGKIQMARQISQEFRISVNKAKDRLVVRNAMAKGGVLRFDAVLRATHKGQGRSMNMIAFVGALPRRTKKGTLAQIKFQIKRSGGKKIIPGAFVGNKGRTLFMRTGKARLPIKALNTIDVPQMFNAKRINAVVVKVMLSKFRDYFSRELRVVLKGYVR